ncbi:type I-E CRISPR-associated endoribonuclease Cas2 [Nocardia speluncae]|uniref:Type I-E CRISPR-associated endoribonuclease Cas2 n=1 Tax=Nocardia speluncae TaxID=419477 RepID=A0A846XGS2_9NOCA|nr:type I-E CRISPR-associated endoribonuclease Cas2e [Nocardia speluncae]NKY33866.1 type I-E CRISPR-associated endoribonuclease Cas2 [Nocardia speluncae]
MTVIVLIAVAPGLRGHLTRWMIEVNAGVFVGKPSRRVRERLWELLADRVRDGQAVMIEPANNEQGWAVRTAGRDRWRPVDFDGLLLSARPRTPTSPTQTDTPQDSPRPRSRGNSTEQSFDRSE